MKYKFCPICGKELEIKYSWDEGGVPYCKLDDMLFFDIPKPCIMVAIIKDKDILLLTQSYIYKNSKVLLTGYVGNNETAEEAVHREVIEESGIKIKNLTYLGTDFVKDKEILMITYMAEYVSGKIKKSDEVEDMGWFKILEALDIMKEDVIGSKVVKKIIDIKKKSREL